MPARVTRSSALSQSQDANEKKGQIAESYVFAPSKNDPYPLARPLRDSTRANRPDTKTRVKVPKSEPDIPLNLGDGKISLVDLGMPTRETFAQLEEQYIQALDPRKRGKALISQAMFDDIWLVLHSPLACVVGTPQFRWWVRKMFALVRPEELDDKVPGPPAIPPMLDANAQALPVVVHGGKRVAIREQIFDILCVAHARVQHGGRDKTGGEVRKRYTWIPKDLIALFVKHCPTCSYKRTPKDTENSDSASLPAASVVSRLESSEPRASAATFDDASTSKPFSRSEAKFIPLPPDDFNTVHSDYGAFALGVAPWRAPAYPTFVPCAPPVGDFGLAPRWHFSAPGAPLEDYFGSQNDAQATQPFTSRLAAMPSVHHLPDIRVPGSSLAEDRKVTLPPLSDILTHQRPPTHLPSAFQADHGHTLASSCSTSDDVNSLARAAGPHGDLMATGVTGMIMSNSGHLQQIDPALLQESELRERQLVMEAYHGVHMLALAAEVSQARDSRLQAGSSFLAPCAAADFV